jgi:hypothetical protein
MWRDGHQTAAPSWSHSGIAFHRAFVCFPHVKARLQPLPWLKACSMPIGRTRISLILNRLAKVKIRRRDEWWFSTSSGGGFGPDRKSKTLPLIDTDKLIGKTKSKIFTADQRE